MLFPVRCFTCGKVIGHLHKTYTTLIEEDGMSRKESLDKIGAVRYCCRRMFLTYIDTFKYISEFNKQNYFFIHENIKEVQDIQPISIVDGHNSNSDCDIGDGDDDGIDGDMARMSLNVDDVDIEIENDDDE